MLKAQTSDRLNSEGESTPNTGILKNRLGVENSYQSSSNLSPRVNESNVGSTRNLRAPVSTFLNRGETQTSIQLQKSNFYPGGYKEPFQNQPIGNNASLPVLGINSQATPSMHGRSPSDFVGAESKPKSIKMKVPEQKQSFDSPIKHSQSQNMIPNMDSDNPLLSFMMVDSLNKNMNKNKKYMKQQDDQIKTLVDSQGKLLEELNDQRRLNIEFQDRYDRDMKRYRRYQLVDESKRLSDSRQREYENLTLLNKLGESMQNGDYSMDFLFKQATGGVPNWDEPETKNVFTSAGNALINQNLYPSRVQMQPPLQYPNNQMNNNNFYQDQKYALPPLAPETKKEKKEEKKKKSGFDMNTMFPMMMMMMMKNNQSSGGKPGGMDSKLHETIEQQNKMLKDLQNNFGKQQHDKYDNEKKYLEEKIDELEKKLDGGRKKGRKNGDMDDDNLPKNAWGANLMFLEAMKNPFYRQQLMLNQQLMQLMTKMNGQPSGGGGNPGGNNMGGFDPMSMMFGFGGNGGKKKGMMKGDKDGKGGKSKKEKEAELARQKEERERLERERLQQIEEQKRLEEEKKKKEEEEKKRILDAKIKKAKDRVSKIKVHTWHNLSIFLFYGKFKQIISKKRETFIEENKKSMTDLMEISKKAMIAITKKGLDPFFNDTKSALNVVSNVDKAKIYSQKPCNRGACGPKAQDLCAKIKFILSALLDGTSEATIDKNIITIIAKVTMEGSFLPDGFFFDSELNRLNFNTFGALKNQSTIPNRVKMMIICYLIYQIFLPRVLKNPWEIFPAIKKPLSDTMRFNIRVAGSVIYWLFWDWIKNNVPVQPGSQTHLPVAMKVKPRQGKIYLDDTVPKMPRSLKPGEEGELVDDVLDKNNDMPGLFLDNKSFLDPLRSLVEGWSDKIGKLVTQVQEELIKEAKTKGAEEQKKRHDEVSNILKTKGWGKYLEKKVTK